MEDGNIRSPKLPVLPLQSHHPKLFKTQDQHLRHLSTSPSPAPRHLPPSSHRPAEAPGAPGGTVPEARAALALRRPVGHAGAPLRSAADALALQAQIPEPDEVEDEQDGHRWAP